MRWVRRLVLLAALAVAALVGVSLLRGADTPPPPRLPAAGQNAAPTDLLDGTLAPTAGSFVGYRVRETRAVRIPLRSRRMEGGIDLVGSTPIRFADYGMLPPSVAGVASVRDHGVMEVRLRLR